MKLEESFEYLWVNDQVHGGIQVLPRKQPVALAERKSLPRQELALRDSRVFLLRLRHGDGIVYQVVENVEIAHAIGLDRRVDDFFCEVALEVEHLFVERHVRRDETGVLASADLRKLNKVAFFFGKWKIII